jgi:hypothetical protein
MSGFVGGFIDASRARTSVGGVAATGRLRPYLPTGAAVLLAVLLRAPSVAALAYPDEGGLLLVARQWHTGGPGLYGDLWVDRPPLLLLFWKAAAGLGGVPAARILAMLAVAVLVVAAAWVGRLAGGPRGAGWAAFLAAALACSPLLGAAEVDAELLAAPLVLLSCGAALRTVALTSPRAQARWALLAGLAGASALLVKQNLADGLVFGAVLALSAGLTGRCTRAAAVRVLAFATLGTAVVLAATLGWVVAEGPGIDALASTLFGFRAQAADVIARGSLAAPESRLLKLVGAGVASGLLAVLVVAVGPLRRGMARREPVAIATVAMVLFGLAGIAAGGSFWEHYALELLPAAVLAIAVVAADGRPVLVSRAIVTLAVVSTVVAVAVALTPLGFPRRDERTLVGWLAQARRPRDSAVVTYGHADLIEAAGLHPPHYPYLWSLPIRARDPRLTVLGNVLAAPDAPTWLVEWNPVDTWGLDSRGAVAHVIARDYRSVGPVCGVPVYLRQDDARALPPRPTSC